MAKTEVLPRPAATVILVRDAAHGLEVLLMQRGMGATVGGGAYVFPGGVLDPGDDEKVLSARCVGLSDATASRQFKLERGGLAYWIAAIRECFEEAGLLLAYDENGELPALDNTETGLHFSILRRQLNAGELHFGEMCREHKLRLATDRMAYFDHWITGAGRPRRYDTRFFIAVAPEAQSPSHDEGETMSNVWIRPAEALTRYRAGEIELIFPTFKSLEVLAGFNDTAAMMAYARAPRPMKWMAPRNATGRDGPRLLFPGDFAYAEVGKLDQEDRGNVAYEIIPGVATRLAENVRRITAPNPGVMTGPGTNTYLLGSSDEFALIDPGPADESHIQALLEETRGRIRWILVTHTHKDHSPAAELLRLKTGAQLLGLPTPQDDRYDQSFRPDRIPAHGERINVAGCGLRVIHTPGHASNHVCYLLEDEKMLFTGDHIMQGSTVVISPPQGNMAAYFASLRLLQREDIAYLAPGHGFLMDKPQEMIERLVLHRMERENKVLKALRECAPATTEQLLPSVYKDVPGRMHPVAIRSLLAHLLKLQAEGRAREADGLWSI